MILYIILAGLLVMLASIAGLVLIWNGFGTFFQRNARFLTTFAAGVFLIVVYSLFQEAVHLKMSLWTIIISGICGALILELITQLLPHSHHHHMPQDCSHDHSILDARRMMIGDAIHNIGDGILLVPAFLIDVRIGIITTAGIFLHEFVQEMAEFFILKESGYSTKRALLFNLLVSSTLFIGIALSLILTTINDFTGILLAIAGGGFIYVLIRDLFPHTWDAIKCGSNPRIHFLALLSGALTMLTMSLATPHSHDVHAEDEHSHSSDIHSDDIHSEDSTDLNSDSKEEHSHVEHGHEAEHSDTHTENHAESDLENMIILQ